MDGVLHNVFSFEEFFLSAENYCVMCSMGFWHCFIAKNETIKKKCLQRIFAFSQIFNIIQLKLVKKKIFFRIAMDLLQRENKLLKMFHLIPSFECLLFILISLDNRYKDNWVVLSFSV